MRAGWLILGLGLGVVGLGARPARAAGGPADPTDLPEEEGEEATPPAAGRVACLDDLSEDGYRRKGVQKRDFLKRHRLALSAVGGFYASDALSSSYAFGGAATFFPAEDLGVEILVTRSPVKFRFEDPFAGAGQGRHFAPGAATQAMAGLVFSPFHAKFKFTEATIVHGDLFVVAGAGRTLHDSVQGLTFEGGVGLQLNLLGRLSFRFDLRDFLLPQEVLGRAGITNNLTLLGGFSFWLG
jgi:outer membrane beta-barrel protein